MRVNRGNATFSFGHELLSFLQMRAQESTPGAILFAVTPAALSFRGIDHSEPFRRRPEVFSDLWKCLCDNVKEETSSGAEFRAG